MYLINYDSSFFTTNVLIYIHSYFNVRDRFIYVFIMVRNYVNILERYPILFEKPQNKRLTIIRIIQRNYYYYRIYVQNS